MDVNLTISLMRGQMGVVIEKAVNAAVETVLGEMIRVVSLKLEEFRREMTAKEKENENIRNMLEMSRCQMKTMRRYVSALTAKEEHQALQSRRAVLVQVDPARERLLQPARDRRSTVTCLSSPSPAPKPAHTEEPAWEKQLPTPKAQTVIQDPISIGETHSEDLQAPRLASVKAENSVMESEGLVTESSDPLWGQMPPVSSEVEHTGSVDSSLHPKADNSEVLNAAISGCGGSSFKVKQEEGEVEIVQVKEEPGEGAKSECPRIELCQQAAEAGPGVSIELPVTQQCPQISCSSVTEPGFTGMDPSTYAEPQLAMAGGQRQVRPWCKDLNLYEEYKRKRIEVRKRSETRRRELEQMLPQALLADLVKERREKTRLRVARWRAKRKLQACLMSQAAQLNGAPPQGLFTQRGSRRQGGATTQHGGFTLSRASTSDTGVYTLPLQVASSPLLATQRLGVGESQLQPGPTIFQQHRTTTAGPDMLQ